MSRCWRATASYRGSGVLTANWTTSVPIKLSNETEDDWFCIAVYYYVNEYTYTNIFLDVLSCMTNDDMTSLLHPKAEKNRTM